MAGSQTPSNSLSLGSSGEVLEEEEEEEEPVSSAEKQQTSWGGGESPEEISIKRPKRLGEIEKLAEVDTADIESSKIIKLSSKFYTNVETDTSSGSPESVYVNVCSSLNYLCQTVSVWYR